jgi:hypothetical protein
MRADTQRPQLSGGEVCAQRSGRARIRRNLGLTPYRLPGCWPHCPFGPFRCTISIPRSVNDEPPSDVYPVQAACRCLRSVMTLRPVRSLPSGGIMPDHASDRGAVRLDPGASRSQAYQPDEHAQTQYVRTWPSACRRPRQRRSSTPGCSNCTRSHPPPASVFPRARHGRSLPGAANLHFGHLRGIGHREPGRILIPGDGAAGDQGLRIGLPARQWQPGDACGLSRLDDFLALWSQAHMPPCNRQVTSTSIHMAKPGLATSPRGSRTAINGRVVFGSNNFRSMLLCLVKGLDSISVASLWGLEGWRSGQGAGIADKTGTGRSVEGKLLSGHAPAGRNGFGDGRRIVRRPAWMRQPISGSGRPRGVNVSLRACGGEGRPGGRRNA